jgi:hypothetical protein
MNANPRRARFQAGAVLLVASLWAAPALAQRAFATPDAAAAALVESLGTQHADDAKLAAIFGPKWRDAVPPDVDRADVDAFLAHYREGHRFQAGADGHSDLVVGRAEPWTFPVPLAKAADGWRFDLPAGLEEIQARYIGRNELDVLQAVRAYHDAQNDYANEDRDGDGVLEYAQKLVSTDGRHDGLYWADDDSGEISPLGPLFGDDAPSADWLGYHYRILRAQGASAPGGAFDFMLGDNMSRGFALVAWPAKYGETGVTTFIISHDGLVFERDLGKDGDRIARAMSAFDPDSGWREITRP